MSATICVLALLFQGDGTSETGRLPRIRTRTRSWTRLRSMLVRDALPMCSPSTSGFTTSCAEI